MECQVRKLFLSLLFILGLLFCTTAVASTYVNGPQTGIWDLAGSPYILTGDISVDTGMSLVIEPNVQIQNSSDYDINIYGNFSANSANFTSGGIGIFVLQNGNADLLNCTFPGVVIDYETGSTGTITNCHIISTLYIRSPAVSVTNGCNVSNIHLYGGATIANNTVGTIYQYNGSPTITGNTIETIYLYSGLPTIAGNTINDKTPLQIWDPDIDTTGISGNTYIAANPYTFITGNLNSDKILGTIDTLNRYKTVMPTYEYPLGKIIIEENATLTISPGIIMGMTDIDDWWGSWSVLDIDIFGILSASNVTFCGPININVYEGGAGNFTDCEMYWLLAWPPESTGSDNTTLESSNEAKLNQVIVYAPPPSATISYLSNSSGSLNNCILRLYGQLYIGSSATVSLLYNDFSSVNIESSATISLLYNDFSSGDLSVSGDPVATICAENNWWGTINTAEIEDKITHHEDDANRPWVDFIPYLLDWPPGPEGNPPGSEYFFGFLEFLAYGRDPVNTATGNFFHSETDLSITSRGLPLVFSRHYNNKDLRSGPLGSGWTHSYYIYLNDDDPNLVNVHWGDGRTDYWNPDGLGGYEPNTIGLYDSLAKNGSNWIVTRKNLNKYTFDSDGLLTAISDKNGNSITLSYTNPSYPNLVTAINDPVGRTLTLSYDASGLIDSITDFASTSRTIGFSYTGGWLTQVTDVMGNTIQYGYDGSGYLDTITDQRGVTTVINTYDGQGRVIEQWDGNGNKSAFSYDTPDVNQTTIIDPNGNTTIHTYFTGYKLLQSIENPLGHKVYYNYDEQGNRRTVTDRNGNTTYFAYDNRGNVIETTAADGGITVVDYNDVNFPYLPTKKIDALSNETVWEYDLKGNVILQIDPNGFERSWTYNSFGQKLTETDENVHIANYIYDSNGLLTEIIDANGNHTWFGYDTLWRLTHLTDGRGGSAGDPAHTMVTVYDEADRVISITGPITSESYLYNEIGRRTHVTNGRGYTTIYQYDNNNNLTRIESPAPSGQTQVIQYSYDELNRKISITDPNGNVTHYEYDLAGRLTKEANPEGDETTYIYDAHGNVLSVTDGNGVITSYSYDSVNRKNHQYDELGNHWYWQYDKLGNLVKHTDAIGSITQYEYDPLKQLVAVIDDANNRTEYEYDPVGNLIQIQDAAGKVIEMKYYDSANRLIRKEDGLAHTNEYEYDGAGNVISETTPNGHTKTFVYDNENRLVEIHYPDSNQVTYSYDNNGNLINMTDPTGTTTYVYDELDRLTSSTDSFSKTVQYGYDIIGNRTSLTYPADSINPARTVTYFYNKANRLDIVIDWSGRVWDYTVDGAGRITDVNNPNGTKEALSYDQAGRLSSLLYKDSSDANFITYSYIRDAMSNPTEIEETGTLEPSPDLFLKEDYTYDNDNRLTSTTVPATYGYDNNGNMTSRVTGGVTTTFTYDYENRLISQTTNGSTIQHVYDGQGNRIARNDNGSEIRYILDRGRSMSHVLCETDDSGDIIAYYIHGPKLLARIGSDGSEHYYHTDHIGSVVALTDDTETITDRYAYTPFGVSAGGEGTTLNPFTYVGGLGVMADADGLYFMRARFYEPESGRFLSKDPILGHNYKPQTLNLYAYSSNNSTVFVDPSGKITQASAFLVGVLYGQTESIGLHIFGEGLESTGVVDDARQVENLGTSILSAGTAVKLGGAISSDPTGHKAAFESGRLAGTMISMGCFAVGDYLAPIVAPPLAQATMETNWNITYVRDVLTGRYLLSDLSDQLAINGRIDEAKLVMTLSGFVRQPSPSSSMRLVSALKDVYSEYEPYLWKSYVQKVSNSVK